MYLTSPYFRDTFLPVRMLAIVSSIVFVLGSSVVGEILRKWLGTTLYSMFLISGSGCLFSILFLKCLGRLARQTSIPKPNFGTLRGLVIGLCFGLGASLCSGISFSLINHQPIIFSSFWDGAFYRFVGNVFPASVEETAFRGGVVHFVSAYLNTTWGVVVGSVPFGALHFFGRLFGNPVTFQHALGVSVAGLLLSLLYLRFGLVSAFGCHWVWNALCIQWVKAMSLPSHGGAQMFEGAWTTTAVLVCLSFLPTLIRDPVTNRA